MRGLSNKEIAAEIGISLGTIKHYVSTIGDKMGIDSDRYMLRTRIVYLMACPLFRIGAAKNDHPSRA